MNTYDRPTVRSLLEGLGFEYTDLDDAIRWALIELLLRRQDAGDMPTPGPARGELPSRLVDIAKRAGDVFVRAPVEDNVADPVEVTEHMSEAALETVKLGRWVGISSSYGPVSWFRTGCGTEALAPHHDYCGYDLKLFDLGCNESIPLPSPVDSPNCLTCAELLRKVMPWKQIIHQNEDGSYYIRDADLRGLSEDELEAAFKELMRLAATIPKQVYIQKIRDNMRPLEEKLRVSGPSEVLALLKSGAIKETLEVSKYLFNANQLDPDDT